MLTPEFELIWPKSRRHYLTIPPCEDEMTDLTPSTARTSTVTTSTAKPAQARERPTPVAPRPDGRVRLTAEDLTRLEQMGVQIRLLRAVVKTPDLSADLIDAIDHQLATIGRD